MFHSKGLFDVGDIESHGSLSNIKVPHGSLLNTQTVQVPELTQTNMIIGDAFTPVRKPISLMRGDDLKKSLEQSGNIYDTFEEGGSLPKAQWWNLPSAYNKVKKAYDFSTGLNKLSPVKSSSMITPKIVPSFSPSTIGNTINYSDVLGQRNKMQQDWMTNTINTPTQLSLPPSSNILDYYPSHNVTKNIFGEPAWWNNSNYTRPYSEKVFHQVTLKDGSTRIMTPQTIN